MEYRVIYSKFWSVICLALSLIFVDIGSAFGSSIHWRSNIVHIAVEGKDLKEVLRDFTSSMGMSASIAPNVQGTVTGRFDMSPQQFLETLASAFSFAWFYNGNVLSITASNDSIHQVIQLKHASTSELRLTLSKLGIGDEHFPLSTEEGAGIVIVNGPPQYVKTIAEIAQRLDESAAQRGDTVVRVFKLKNAWAADRVVKLSGSDVTLKGLASVLSAMFRNSNDASSGHAEGASKGVRRMQALTDVGGGASGASGLNAAGSTGVSSAQAPLPPNMSFSSAGLTSSFGDSRADPMSSSSTGSLVGMSGPDASGSSSGGADSHLPNIQADPITNSVLIRDLASRIGQYASLIDTLDARPKIIQIEAHIMEIDSDALKQIGVDFRASGSRFDIQKSTGVYAASSNAFVSRDDTALSSTSPTTGIGGISAVLGDAGSFLMTRVNALEGTSQAKVDATPRVATLDNVEASMDSKSTFYVKVNGYTSGDLYSVSTGVSLKVRPMVVLDESGARIKLQVQIEDGQLSGDTVDGLPVVTTSEISTEAFVSQGESLLIAGYSTDANVNGVTGIPGLSKIPFIGGLFRYTNSSQNHMERVYLISPRVLDL